MTDMTSRPARNRGVFRLGEEILANLIDLPTGQRVIGLRENRMMLAIDVHVEGDGLPVCAPGSEPPIINAEDYVTAEAVRWAARGRDLAEMAKVLAARWGKSGDASMSAASAQLLEVIDGLHDPRWQYSTVPVQVTHS